MRSNLNSSSANNRTPLRPPFKVGNVANSSTQGSNFPSGPGGRPKETPEMTAWLRRKDYNPMKAAAEAKKANTLKQRGDQFTSNRSVSFHQGAAAQSALLARIKQEKIRARHNVTQDDLLHDEEACGPETILASFSRGINKDLNRLKHSEEPAHNNQAQSSSLERAVRQLAVKCQRSITLIKNVHHGELSASIENLLLDIDPPKNRQESISEQLERLSEAFDAIQKYLEVSSLSGSLPASPSAVSPSTTAISFLPNAVQSTSSEAGEGVQNNSTPES
ncbi:hypothetical protein AB6A40_008672 [Gnathostoma spinigerum]|uniref:Uncharacterized protein n=1 Tax=Gnathostoma spinigerum TaxID=75299 RepID=A0ABD6EQ25_9BILA